MLKEDPRNRPNIYEVVREVCNMQGKEIPIKDVCRSAPFRVPNLILTFN